MKKKKKTYSSSNYIQNQNADFGHSKSVWEWTKKSYLKGNFHKRTKAIKNKRETNATLSTYKS